MQTEAAVHGLFHQHQVSEMSTLKVLRSKTASSSSSSGAIPTTSGGPGSVDCIVSMTECVRLSKAVA